jgi:hypothetical protein
MVKPRIRSFVNPHAHRVGAQALESNDKETSEKYTQGQLSIEIKINEVPKSVETLAKDQKYVRIVCGTVKVAFKIPLKKWNKFLKAQEDFDQWVAKIGGTIAQKTKKELILEGVSIQTFEKKDKTKEEDTK